MVFCLLWISFISGLHVDISYELMYSVVQAEHVLALPPTGNITLKPKPNNDQLADN